jgi:hypothetical protein
MIRTLADSPRAESAWPSPSKIWTDDAFVNSPPTTVLRWVARQATDSRDTRNPKAVTSGLRSLRHRCPRSAAIGGRLPRHPRSVRTARALPMLITLRGTHCRIRTPLENLELMVSISMHPQQMCFFHIWSHHRCTSSWLMSFLHVKAAREMDSGGIGPIESHRPLHRDSRMLHCRIQDNKGLVNRQYLHREFAIIECRQHQAVRDEIVSALLRSWIRLAHS